MHVMHRRATHANGEARRGAPCLFSVPKAHRRWGGFSPDIGFPNVTDRGQSQSNWRPPPPVIHSGSETPKRQTQTCFNSYPHPSCPLIFFLLHCRAALHWTWRFSPILTWKLLTAEASTRQTFTITIVTTIGRPSASKYDHDREECIKQLVWRIQKLLFRKLLIFLRTPIYIFNISTVSRIFSMYQLYQG